MRINRPSRMLNNYRIFRKYGIYTPVIRIEASSVCQLRCPCCIQTTGKRGIITQQFLRFRDFAWFTDRYPEFQRIELSCWGEPFLNPEMNEIMAHAYSKGIALTARSGSNFNSMNEELLEKLVKYQFQHITVAIDGASSEIYRIYRQGGDFDTVIRNVRRLNELKQKYASRYPELTWQFVAFGHNEHEIPKAEQMARELGMAFALKLNGVSSYSPVRNTQYLREKIGAATWQEYWLRYKKEYLSPCSSMWMYPQIASDGKFLGCCENMWGDFGNVFDIGLEACVKSEAFKYAKKMVTGKAPAQQGIPCSICTSYTSTIKEHALCSPPSLFCLAKTIWKR